MRIGGALAIPCMLTSLLWQGKSYQARTRHDCDRQSGADAHILSAGAADAASLRRNDPWAIQPGWRVVDMLLVATFQVRHPILSLILMKTDDPALHGDLACTLEA